MQRPLGRKRRKKGKTSDKRRAMTEAQVMIYSIDRLLGRIAVTLRTEKIHSRVCPRVTPLTWTEYPLSQQEQRQAPPTRWTWTKKPCGPSYTRFPSAYLRNLLENRRYNQAGSRPRQPNQRRRCISVRTVPNGSDESVSSGKTMLPDVAIAFSLSMSRRKHLKRHDRPYRCTFPWCGKEFGSKNDWKRHENSQHYQLEVWRCDEQPAELPGKECGQLFPRRALLRQHLQTVHGVEGGPRQEEQLNKCRVGRNLERRFWCGFCSRMVDASGDGPHVGAERFDHIDDHISGRNGSAKKTMAEWKSMESVTDILDVDFGPPPIRLADTSYNPAALAQLEDDTLSQSFLIKPGKRKLLDDQRQEESQPKRMKEGNWMWTCVSAGHEPGGERFTLT